MRIAITGPESSGKTTLAKELALRLGIRAVPEFARFHLTKYGPEYSSPDLLYFAQAQLALENIYLRRYPQALITDTDLLVLKIWHEEKFGPCPPVLDQLYRQTPYDLILLCTPDLPWSPDPLRENPADRDRLYALYAAESVKRGLPFEIISGTDRLDLAWHILRKVMNHSI